MSACQICKTSGPGKTRVAKRCATKSGRLAAMSQPSGWQNRKRAMGCKHATPNKFETAALSDAVVAATARPSSLQTMFTLRHHPSHQVCNNPVEQCTASKTAVWAIHSLILAQEPHIDDTTSKTACFRRPWSVSDGLTDSVHRLWPHQSNAVQRCRTVEFTCVRSDDFRPDLRGMNGVMHFRLGRLGRPRDKLLLPDGWRC